MSKQAAQVITLPVKKDWLESLLQEAYKTNARIESYRCEIIGQESTTSIITKIELDWSESAGLPRSLVIKQPTMQTMETFLEQLPDHVQEDDSYMILVHNNEVQAYRFFTRGQVQPIPMPRCLYTEEINKDEGKNGMIILEFVPGKSQTFNDNYNLNQLEDFVKHIASLQAYSIANREDCSVFSPLICSGFIDPSMSCFVEKMKQLRKAYPDLLPVSDGQIDKVYKKMKELTPLLTQPDSIGNPTVLSLGDIQTPNILWRTEDGGAVGNQVLAFIDFQLLCMGSCFYDIATMAFWGMSTDDRKMLMPRLLRLYHSVVSKKTYGKAPVKLADLESKFNECYLVVVAVFTPIIADMMTIGDQWGFTDETLAKLVEKICILFNEERVIV